MIFKILTFFTTVARIGMGLKTGWSSYKNAEENTVRFSEEDALRCMC